MDDRLAPPGELSPESRRSHVAAMATNLDRGLADDLLERAEIELRRRLVGNETNPTLLASLGRILRKQGRLEAASSVYAQLAAGDAADEATRYVHAILSGGPVPGVARPDAKLPAPFVVLKDFLTSDLRRDLEACMLSGTPSFDSATVGSNNDYDPDHLRALELAGAREIKDAFRERIRGVLPSVQPRLGLPAFEPGPIEIKVRAYRDGDFFRLHQDAVSGRRISFTYFFHRMPRRFRGGNLLLFDSSADGRSLVIERFTRIIPVTNTLVAFPSHCHHLVSPVECSSADLADSRLVVNGHVREQATVASAPRAGA